MTILSVTDASKLLGISGRRLRKMIAEGKIKAVKIGLTWAIEKKEIMKWHEQYYPMIKSKFNQVEHVIHMDDPVHDIAFDHTACVLAKRRKGK